MEDVVGFTPLRILRPSDHDVEDPDGQSLFGVIDTEKLRCLNERVAGSCVNPFKPYAKVSLPVCRAPPPASTRATLLWP